MKVIFKQLNPKKFAELIFDMKECLSTDELNREDSCFSFSIPEEIVKEIIFSEFFYTTLITLTYLSELHLIFHKHNRQIIKCKKICLHI